MRQTLRIGALAFIIVAAIFAFTGWGPERGALTLAVGVAFAAVLFLVELWIRRR